MSRGEFFLGVGVVAKAFCLAVVGDFPNGRFAVEGNDNGFFAVDGGSEFFYSRNKVVEG